MALDYFYCDNLQNLTHIRTIMKTLQYKHLIAVFLFTFVSISAFSYELPSLGDSASSIVSAQEEYKTGQNWLRAFRRQAPISDDPLLYTYIHELIQTLAYYSPLNEKYFSLVVVDSPDFNAFAVPGNVIGINTGLFRYAESEDELAAVISHELAHLSQRHYARSLEQQKKQNIATLAAFLGSLLVLASGDTESGMAALTATQAAAISNQLQYSRTQEEEADRIGIQTLAHANMNPEAIAHMFQHMMIQTRYRTDLKEFAFLLTHPLADSRVADALNKARLYPKRNDKDSFDFHLMKARAQFLNQKNPKKSVEYFKSELDIAKHPKAAKYGLALSLLASGETTTAEAIINEIYMSDPHSIAYILLKSDLLQQQQNIKGSEELLATALKVSPKNYALSMSMARLYIKTNQAQKAVTILRSLASANKPDTPDIWYLLAEVEGLAGNIAEVHLARAEYYVRIGALIQAQRHLYLALPLLNDNLQAKTRAQLNINAIEKLKQEQQF
jgi:predicted Zn-dependent protease